MSTTKKAIVNTPSVPTVMCATNAEVAIHDTSAANAHQSITTQTTATSLPDQRNAKTDNNLPTPVLIDNLGNVLTDHPDKQFVFQICNNLRGEACVSFEGQRAPRFSHNLLTALANPNMVTQNLEHEISLGRVAGPFDTTPSQIFRFDRLTLFQKRTLDNLCLFLNQV